VRQAREADYRTAASRCYDAEMSKTRTTLTIDEEVLRAVKVRAARTGKGDGEVIEEALRRDLGLELLDRLWERNDLGESEAMELAVEAQHSTRPRKH
jgi:hypothetical protein